MLRPPCPDKTKNDLEWGRVTAALADRCVFALGKELAHDLPFAETVEEARLLAEEAEEATRMLAKGEPLPVFDVPDVEGAIARLGAQGVLAPTELLGIARVLEVARALRRYLATRRETLPRLYVACSTDPSLDDVADRIRSAFDADGTLSDRASPRLNELRGEVRTSRQRMTSRLEEFMRRYEGIVQERFVTEREGRWVIPVRSDAHERFPGIVHAMSNSGSTLFVEPRAVIPLGNRLKVLAAELAREEHAIYGRLSAILYESIVSIRGAADALARADVRAATARLAVEFELSFPKLSPEPVLELFRARHLLLAVDGVAVVPSDLAIRARHVMVVSGPNAGGKTVSLKTMGLSALMVRAGLPVAALPESTVGIFDLVLTDIGDDQSLSKNLSTFSAHVQNLAHLLEETHDGTLVLIDEIATGTDPREGEALAAAVLDSLSQRGGAVVATTHYEGLKALGVADDRFENASVGFDREALRPTFRLARGVPGSSSALFVAERFGIPRLVIERASNFLSREERSFEDVVKRLDHERAATELARANLEASEAKTRAVRAELEAEIDRVRRKQHETLAKEAEQLSSGVRRAQAELRDLRAKIRDVPKTPESLRDLEKSASKLAQTVSLGGALDPTALRRETEKTETFEGLDPKSIKRGARVYVPRLRAEAEILDVSGDDIKVTAGALKLTVHRSELRAIARNETASGHGSRGREHAKNEAIANTEVAIQTSDNTCDLRGLRTDDALSMATSFLDRALGSGTRVVFLIHGHGTGAIRDALRRELKDGRYVVHFRAGEQSEGGDGVTIAWLK